MTSLTSADVTRRSRLTCGFCQYMGEAGNNGQRQFCKRHQEFTQATTVHPFSVGCVSKLPSYVVQPFRPAPTGGPKGPHYVQKSICTPSLTHRARAIWVGTSQLDP